MPTQPASDPAAGGDCFPGIFSSGLLLLAISTHWMASVAHGDWWKRDWKDNASGREAEAVAGGVLPGSVRVYTPFHPSVREEEKLGQTEETGIPLRDAEYGASRESCHRGALSCLADNSPLACTYWTSTRSAMEAVATATIPMAKPW